MKKKEGKNNKKKWTWELTETIVPMMTEEEISNAINRKLAYIIVELEHNPVNYIKLEENTGEAL